MATKNEYGDLIERIKGIEEHLGNVERHVAMPTWKKIVYGVGLTFLSVSTVRYWIGRADQPQYVALPCVTSTFDVQEAKYGR